MKCHFRVLVLLVFALCCVIFKSHAQNNIISQSLTSLYSEKKLTVAIYESSFPYHFIDEEGNAAGLMPDLWRLWAQKQQVKIEFVSLPWSETMKQVSEGKVDAHAGLSIIESRKNNLSFTKALFPIYTHVYVNSNLVQVNSMEALSPYAIGVVTGSAHIDMLAKKYPQLTHKIFAERHELYEAAIKKEVLAFTGLERLPDNYQYYSQLLSMYPAYKKLRYQQEGYGVAVAKNNQDLLGFIEQGMAKISATEMSTLELKWLGMNKNKDGLIVAFPSNYPPYAAQSPTGKPHGLIIDLWELWAKKTKTKITFVARPFEDSLTLIENNEVDVLPGFPQAWLDKSRFTLAMPIYKSKTKVYINRKYPNVESLHYFDKSKHRIGIWKKSPFKQILKTTYPRVDFQLFPTFKALLKAAELGEIDAFIGHIDFINIELLKTNLQSVFYTLKKPVFSFSIAPLVKKGNDRLINAINEGFEQIELKELVMIEERWLNGDDLYYKNKFKKVTLTEQEEAFIVENPMIDVGFIKSLAPIEFINEQGEFDGIDSDILKLISKRTGLSFNFQGFDSWFELYNSMLNGEINMLTSITPTESRRKKLLFSKPYWDTPWVILHLQHIGKQSQLKDFYGKKVAIVKGYYLADYIRDKHPQITLSFVDNRQTGLVALQKGQVEGLIETISSASQLLKQESLVNLAISVIDDVPTDKSHIGLQKNDVLLRSIIDKGLASISAKEKNNINEKWFSIDINTGIDKTVIMRVAGQLTLLVVIVLAIILMWNRRLKAEIKHRTQLEEKMKHMATHDDLTGLANRVLLKDRINTAIEFHQRQSLLMAVLFLDLDGFKNINDTYGHDVGDELLLLVAKRLQLCVRKSDTVVRFGGDEFVLLLTGLHHANEATFVAEKVLKVLQSPFELSSIKVQIGCSIGIAMYPNDGDNDIDLLKEADTLMYKVKSAGKNHYLMST